MPQALRTRCTETGTWSPWPARQQGDRDLGHLDVGRRGDSGGRMRHNSGRAAVPENSRMIIYLPGGRARRDTLVEANFVSSSFPCPQSVRPSYRSTASMLSTAVS